MAYCDVHRAALQVMMHRGAMEEDETLRTIQSLAQKLPGLDQTDVPANDKGLKKFFNVVNKEIGPDGINWAIVKEATMEATKQKFWGLESCDLSGSADTKQKEAEILHVKASAALSDAELGLFKKIVEHLVTRPVILEKIGGTIEKNVAINLGKEVNLGGEDSIRCIDKLVGDQWLLMEETDRSGKKIERLTLGIRSVLDLKRWIRNKWNREELYCDWVNDFKFTWGAPAPQAQGQASQKSAAGVGEGGPARLYDNDDDDSD
mmetsp:Transcript_69175/g.164978  ORF Transcript_69175/g.164978 Transcript_69175/m.164978 type:complete len:262 (-) Transcript_69175:58-843(-)